MPDEFEAKIILFVTKEVIYTVNLLQYYYKVDSLYKTIIEITY